MAIAEVCQHLHSAPGQSSLPVKVSCWNYFSSRFHPKQDCKLLDRSHYLRWIFPRSQYLLNGWGWLLPKEWHGYQKVEAVICGRVALPKGFHIRKLHCASSSSHSRNQCHLNLRWFHNRVQNGIRLQACNRGPVASRSLLNNFVPMSFFAAKAQEPVTVLTAWELSSLHSFRSEPKLPLSMQWLLQSTSTHLSYLLWRFAHNALFRKVDCVFGIASTNSCNLIRFPVISGIVDVAYPSWANIKNEQEYNILTSTLTATKD